MVVVVAAGSTFVAVLLSGLWLVRSARRQPMELRIRSIGAARRQDAGVASAPFEQRVIAPAIDVMGSWLAALLPARFVHDIEQRLVVAGQPVRPAAFFALVIGSAALFGGAYLGLVLAASDGAPTLAALLPVAPLAIVGLLVPLVWVSSQARARQGAIIRSLPDSLDLLTLCVEAGLGLDAAFQQLAEKQSGPLVDEVRQMLREIAFGKTRREALHDMAERTGIDDIRSFVNAIIQAEQLGTSVAKMLRAQGQQMRVRRRQRAEESARRAPVKMVFPLVFCLMPSLFIFILGPIIVSIAGYISGS